MVMPMKMHELQMINNYIFIFKGGTSLMLLLNEFNRFSVDIDILMDKGRENSIVELIMGYKDELFLKIEEDKRKPIEIIKNILNFIISWYTLTLSTYLNYSKKEVLFMPKLLLNEEVTELAIELKTYYDEDTENGYRWCDIRIAIHNDYINFDQTNEFLMGYEVNYLAKWLKRILDEETIDEKEISFTEPELNFRVHLPYEEHPKEEGSTLLYVKGGVLKHPLLLDVIIEFSSNGVYCGEQWCITLDKEEIQEFYDQLICEMNKCLVIIPKNEEINPIKINAAHFKKNFGKPLSEEQMIKVHDLINSDSFKKRIDAMTNGTKLLCAKATYSKDFGKEYTFFVDEKLEDADWYIEDTFQHVYIKEFLELAIDELPVDYWHMKKIVPIDNKKIEYNDIVFELNSSEDGFYACLSFSINDFIYGISLSSKDATAWFVYWILAVLYMESIYDGSAGSTHLFDEIFFEGFKINGLTFKLLVNEYNIPIFLFSGISLSDSISICKKMAEALYKHKQDPEVFAKTKDVIKIENLLLC